MGYGLWCAYSDPVISVGVLHLFYNKLSGYIWYKFIAETMYNLSSTKVLLRWSVSNDCIGNCALHCTVQDLKYAPCSKYHWLSILGADWLLVRDHWWGSWLQCRRQPGRCLFGTVQVDHQQIKLPEKLDKQATKRYHSPSYCCLMRKGLVTGFNLYKR